MTYSIRNEADDGWDALQLPRPTYLAGESPVSDQTLLDNRYYEDVFPEITSPCESFPIEPDLIDQQAVWTLVVQSDEDCAATWREQHQQSIQSQVPVNRSIDPDVASAQDDLAEQARVTNIELAGTADEDLPTFDTDISTRAMSTGYLARKNATQGAALLADDTERVDAGSDDAMTTAERNETQVWFTNSTAGQVEDPPPVVAPLVAAPGKDYGDLEITRVWEDSGEYAGWPGYYWKATMSTGNINALGLAARDAAGNSDGNYSFQSTGTPGVYATHLQVGRGTSVPEDFNFDLLRGSESISGEFTLKAGVDSNERRVRW